MDSPRYSIHGAQRMQQRGMRERDIDLVLRCGTQLDDFSFLLSKKDAAREIQRRKQEIQALERLRGVKVVVKEGVIVTCLRATRNQVKKILRRAH